MILIDNSGSMAQTVPGGAYDPATTYPVLQQCDAVTTKQPRSTTVSGCVSTKVYQSSKKGEYTCYATTVAAVSDSSAQTALNTVGYWSGKIAKSTVNLYTGNYLNYLIGVCGGDPACQESKMKVAQDVVNFLLDNVHGVRFGVMTFYYGSNGVRGGKMVAEIGKPVGAMKAAVNQLTPTGDTPLGEFAYDAGQYYKGATLTDGTTFTSPIQLSCQPNLVILITDGMQTSGMRTLVPPGSSAPDSTNNVASDLFTQDYSSAFSGVQNVIVHTVGFGIGASESAQAIADLKQAAKNGGGQFYEANNKTDLEKSLQDAIRRIVQATFTFATPVLPSTSTTGSSKAYLAAFKSDPSRPFWQGYLKAYQRDSQVLVTPPILALNDSSYQAFKTANSSRTKVLIAGANDGMLHAFKESDGAELWGFIPSDLLEDLQGLTATSGEHQFFVDGSPIAADVKISGTWKTIVVFGLRRGGKTYHALDITDTTNPRYLWSFTDTKLGETWSEPAIGKVKIGGADKFVAFVGGGYDTPQNNALGKAFFVIDLATGAKLWEYYNDGTSDDRQYMYFSIPANPTAVDLNSDGYIDRVYIGDVGGQIWKFDVSAGATSSWGGKRLFAAPPTPTTPPPGGEYYPPQAVYGTPALALAPDLKLWVYFGTGDRNHPNNTTAPNRFYGIRDTTDMTNGSALTESSLADVTSSNGSSASGWFFRLGSNEKVLATANVFNMNVLFSSFTPTTTTTCESGGGTAKLYSVQVLTGYAAIDFVTGLALGTTDSSATRSATIGGGIASMPIIVITPPTSPGQKASSSAITGTTNQQLLNNTVPAPPFLKQVRSWMEQVQ